MKILNKFIVSRTNKHTESHKHPVTFVWGVLSVNESIFEKPNCFSLNDIELFYNAHEKKYFFNINTIYMYDNPSAQYVYLKGLLNEFTKWMNENNYNTTVEFPLWRVFAKGIDINTRFDSIEEAYAAFKMMVNGFCSLEN